MSKDYAPKTALESQQGETEQKETGETLARAAAPVVQHKESGKPAPRVTSVFQPNANPNGLPETTTIVEDIGGETGTVEPVSASQAVENLWAAPKATHKALVHAAMKSTDGFIVELAKEEKGRKLLESMVNGSVTSWIPGAANLVSLLTPVGTQNSLVQGAVGWTITLPLGIVAGSLSSLQRLVGMMWSGLISNHREWIKELMRQEFDLKDINDTWSEVALRRTYMTFHRVPKGMVRSCVNVLNRNRGLSSWYQEDKISLAGLLPTGVTMGGVEPFSRMIGTKFLKGGSKYSKRMKTKNAWTMTVLHEVGHSVDAKHNIMGKYGDKVEFGGWNTHNWEVADDMLNAYTEAPPPEFTQEEVSRREEIETELPTLRDTFFSKHDEQYNLYRSDKDYFRYVKKPAREAMLRNQEEFSGIEADATNRAWKTSHGVTREMLKEAINAAAAKKDPWAAAAEFSPSEETNTVGRQIERRKIESHPAVDMVQKNFAMGAWARRDSTMKKMTEKFEGRYFQRSYPGQGNKVDGSEWVSFLVSSRSNAVSHYQYRAPGEWFAELFAHYYLGTLGGHPMYDWFKENIDKEMGNDVAELDLKAPPEPLTVVVEVPSAD